MLIVPLQPVPNQVVFCQLAGQSCEIAVYQTSYGLFCNVTANGALIIAGVICQNLNRIVRSAYLGLVGDFVFADNQGTADPDYAGLGGRFSLVYLEESDLAGA